MNPLPMRPVQSKASHSMKRLVLCRHGETSANYKKLLQGRGIDLPLNERGVVQAKSLAERLRTETVARIRRYFKPEGMSTTRHRAQETAKIVRQHHPAATWFENPDLAEISWGAWEGTTATEDVESLLRNWDEGDYEACAPGGESPFVVEERSVSLIYNLIRARQEDNLVFILHGRLLRIIMSSLIHRNLSQMDSFRHHNCNINVLDVEIMDPASSSQLSSEVQPVDQETRRATGSALSHPQDMKITATILDDCTHLTDYLL
ncbi:hypothetical protein SmJEL517_g05830 [Synchytrium microbalum]|uniref:Uncharacterized protein n=1 Tax=Synchytrium microbalum TaxID=1806994 RepID=A0A507BTI3_9FUNG|nr:uncharacterized protein SmJEL517_g05830 [Synchytrium microbalum]TPX30648.1 hypothetical protein SmJEL517_g05830 [Synchytrium microbalum]